MTRPSHMVYDPVNFSGMFLATVLYSLVMKSTEQHEDPATLSGIILSISVEEFILQATKSEVATEKGLTFRGILDSKRHQIDYWKRVKC